MKALGLGFEQKLWAQGYGVVVGCDEVGRGALAGPIVAAVVAFGDEWKVESGKKCGECKTVSCCHRSSGRAWCSISNKTL